MTSIFRTDQNPLVGVTYKSTQKKDGHHSPINGYKRERDSDNSPIIEKKPKLEQTTIKSQRTPEAYRPILSPIKLSSDSPSGESLSPPLSQPNGHPSHHYSNDEMAVEVSHSKKHHRHKHRSSSSKHHRHRQDKSHERSNERKHARHHHREDKERPLSRHLSLQATKDYGRLRKTDSYYR